MQLLTNLCFVQKKPNQNKLCIQSTQIYKKNTKNGLKNANFLQKKVGKQRFAFTHVGSPRGHFRTLSQGVVSQLLLFLYPSSPQINLRIAVLQKQKDVEFSTSPCFVVRVEDGIRTHDLRNHNPSL